MFADDVGGTELWKRIGRFIKKLFRVINFPMPLSNNIDGLNLNKRQKPNLLMCC